MDLLEKINLIEKLCSELKQLNLPNGAQGAVWLNDVVEIIENFYTDQR